MHTVIETINNSNAVCLNSFCRKRSQKEGTEVKAQKFIFKCYNCKKGHKRFEYTFKSPSFKVKQKSEANCTEEMDLLVNYNQLLMTEYVILFDYM